MNITQEYQCKILHNMPANRIQHFIKYIIYDDQGGLFRYAN